jgi:hypothetical protein
VVFLFRLFPGIAPATYQSPKDDDDDDFCEDWHDEVENWAYIYQYTRE